ncbi:MAG: hypothetical protein HQL13_02715 [Candidatus Omnitrophica bacterium]|nr:hypothetical protein [Candidatus Omnitrophota bacterium]
MKTSHLFYKNWLGPACILLLCVISRLPQLLSPYLHADYNGDECVMGLMASHIAKGQEFPFYFWGQSYGFCWIEAGAIALAIKFFGIGLLSIKIPMLLLWSVGCVCFYLAMSAWTTKIYGFLMTSIFIFSPAWMAWSMRARGGYITAFLLSSIILYLISRSWPTLNQTTERDSPLERQGTVPFWFFLGIFSGFIFFSQPIYLLGLLPIVAYSIGRQKNFKSFLFFGLGFLAIFILGKLMIYFQGNTGYWKPAWYRLSHFKEYLGYFHFAVIEDLTQDARIFKDALMIANVWWWTFWVSLGLYIWRLISRYARFVVSFRPLPMVAGADLVSARIATTPLSTLFLISIVLILASMGFINYEDRYFLSVSVFFIFWFGVHSFEWFRKHLFFKIIIGLVTGFFIISGILLALNFRDFYRITSSASKEGTEMQKIHKVIDYLKSNGVKRVFSVDDDLSWKLIYFSNEEILSRWNNDRSRRPAYVKAVNEALLHGEKTAVVGEIMTETAAYMVIQEEGQPNLAADPYFVYLNPSPMLIINKLGFGFQNLSSFLTRQKE